MIALQKVEAQNLPQSIPTLVVPFREQVQQKRGDQLKTFVAHIHKHHPDWIVLIIEQSEDGQKFNRGKLLNVGARLADMMGSKHVVFHDVDLLPLTEIVAFYTAFPCKPIHVGKAWTSKYDSPNFLGGVLSMSLDDFKLANGFPNNFWGWGGEDDAMLKRLEAQKLQVFQPTLRGTGFEELPHVDTRTNQQWKNMKKWENLQSDDGKDGFKNVQFSILQTETLTPKIHKLTVGIV